jgi:hypothetical protein
MQNVRQIVEFRGEDRSWREEWKRTDACSDFALGFVAVERRQTVDLPVGDLPPIRDFLDARDAATAIERLAR